MMLVISTNTGELGLGDILDVDDGSVILKLFVCKHEFAFQCLPNLNPPESKESIFDKH